MTASRISFAKIPMRSQLRNRMFMLQDVRHVRRALIDSFNPSSCTVNPTTILKTSKGRSKNCMVLVVLMSLKVVDEDEVLNRI
jgi:hypothetical protein